MNLKFIILGSMIMSFSCVAENFNISINGDIGECSNVTSETVVKECFGIQNITSGEDYNRWGDKYPTTTLFPNDEGKKLVIYWNEGAKEGFSSINITSPQSKWIVAGKLHIGQDLSELLRLNKEPLAISHYDNDDQGLILWKKGKLANTIANASVYLTPKGELTDAQWSGISGQSFVWSGEVDKLGVELEVTEIMLHGM